MKKKMVFQIILLAILIVPSVVACQGFSEDDLESISPRPTPSPQLPTATLPSPPPTPKASAIVIPPAISPTDPVFTPTLPSPEYPIGVGIPRLTTGEDVIVSEIKMFTETDGWAIGGEEDPGGHILYTFDGGNTWADVTPPELTPNFGESRKAAFGFFLDQDTAWVTFYNFDFFNIPENPIVWFTDDAGQTWEPRGNLDTRGLPEVYLPMHFFFVDADNGWLMINVGAGMSKVYFFLYHTEDGGENWIRIQDPYTDSGMNACPKTGMVFGHPNTGLVTRDCAGLIDGAHVFGTGNGGDLWNYFELPPPKDALDGLTPPIGCKTHSPIFTSHTTVLVAVSCVRYNADDTKTETHYLYSSIDSGLSWQGSAYPGGEILVIDNDFAFAFGRDISRSTDSGATWEHVKTVFWDGQFSFVDRQVGWAVARSEAGIALVKTTDGAKTWALLSPVIGE
jgi:photosystem II stability/assembly factor-like uncharacterized protein